SFLKDLITYINIISLYFLCSINECFSSHSAVNNGEVNFYGDNSKICLPLEVTFIFPSRDSIAFILNSLSMISALVATVPIPPVSFNVSLCFLLFNLKNFCGLSIAFNKVPSLKYDGGVVSCCSILYCVIFNLEPSDNCST